MIQRKTRVTAALTAMLIAVLLSAIFVVPAFADAPAEAAAAQTEQAADENAAGDKALGAGIAIGLAAAGGAVAMGIAVAKSAEGISRQPEAESKIRTTLMLGLVFIETAIIYALLVVILIIFVL